MKKTNAIETQYAFDAIYIQTQQHQAAENYMESIMRGAYLPKPKIGIMVGESGMGKTKLCRQFRKSHKDIETEEKTQKTVVYIKLSSNASVGDILKAIYFELMGVPFRGKATNRDKQTLLEKKLRDYGVRLIIIDEAHHAMSENNTEKSITGQYMNFLKTLLDDSGVPILLVGMPNLLNLRKISSQSQKNSTLIKQFRRRSKVPHVLPLMHGDNVSISFNTITSTLENLDVDCDCLAPNDVRQRLYLCSGGSFGILFELIMDAIIETPNGTAITQESLGDAVSSAIDEKDNAFDFSPVELKTKLLDLKRFVEKNAEDAA